MPTQATASGSGGKIDILPETYKGLAQKRLENALPAMVKEVKKAAVATVQEEATAVSQGKKRKEMSDAEEGLVPGAAAPQPDSSKRSKHG